MDGFLLVVKWNDYAPYDYYECNTKNELDDLILRKEKEGYIFLKVYSLIEERE